MSAISEKVRAAIFSKLNVQAISDLVGLDGANAKVYESEAPAGMALPFVIFQRQAPGNVDYSFGPTLVLEDDLWLIKAITDKDSSVTQSPQSLGQQIATACEAAIGNSLSVTGNTVVWCARSADMPPYQERLNDRLVYHRGFLLQVKTA